MLSHYRVHASLPLSQSSFLMMLYKNAELHKSIKALSFTDELNALIETHHGQDEIYNTRVSRPAEELNFMIKCFELDENAAKFLTQTLSVMYANLLLLYGANSEALNFFKSISSTEQYNYFYSNADPIFETS